MMDVQFRRPEARDMMDAMDDDVLWMALRGADEAAFRELFGRHNKAVYNVAFRHAASWTIAEDATQACFGTVWRQATRNRLPVVRSGAVRAWLCACGRNEARNLVRSDRRRFRLIGRAGEAPPSWQHDNVDAWLMHEESMRCINGVLSRLPDGQRQVVELVAWGGCSMTEVADALGVAVGTVKSRLARARRTLATSEVAHLLGKEN